MGKFSENLRTTRKGQGLTQDLVGERCGLSGKYVGELERGEASPSLEVIEKLALGLKVGVVVLVGDDADSLSAAELRAEIVLGLDKLDDEELRQLLRIVRLADCR